MLARVLTLLALLAAPALAQTPAAPPSSQLPPSQVQVPATPASPSARRSPPASSRTAPVASGPALIDVNSADETTLDSLPGVGPVRAKAIVANRPYTEKQQLVAKKAIPANVLAAIEDKIALVNVNSASAADMAKILPNVGPVRSQKIVDNRPYASLPDLVAKGALTPGVFAGLRGLITTGP